jgi:hypothetical protein
MSTRNAIFVIKPYKWEGLWVFDDPDRGLLREPFVEGADTMIDRATRDIPHAERGFLALFSASAFPGATICIEWVRQELSGNVYRWPEVDLEGWLCPALLAFLDPPPEKIYIQVKPAG